MTQKETILSSLDGSKYVFVHPDAKSEIGQLLSPLSYAPFTHPKYGRFHCVLGYSYWIACGKVAEANELRTVSRSYAITKGRGIKKDYGVFIATRTHLREMTYATILKIDEYCKNNSEDVVTMKHTLAGNNLPYVHVRNIRSKDTNSLYGQGKAARVLVMSEYKDLSKIYKLLGNVYKTERGRSLLPLEVLELISNLGGFEPSDPNKTYDTNQLDIG